MKILSPEIYRRIVAHVSSRADLAALCATSRSFRVAAERVLYNTLHLRDARRTIVMCDLLSRNQRIASLVDALALFVLDEDEGSENDDSSEGGEDEENRPAHSRSSSDPNMDDEEDLPSRLAVQGRTLEKTGTAEDDPLPPNYWPSIATCLRATTKLRFLTVYLGVRVRSTDQAWILSDTSFQLHTFHCDFAWDQALARFLSTQHSLVDLFIADFTLPSSRSSAVSHGERMVQPLIPAASLPALSRLECTFVNAVTSLVPGRPVTRLKTSLSALNASARDAELATLMSAAVQSTVVLRALDVGDALFDYDDEESLSDDEEEEGEEPHGTTELPALLRAVCAYPSLAQQLRYLGTIRLPPSPTRRTQFYASLCTMQALRAVELEVSSWTSHGAGQNLTRLPRALIALSRELTIYCPRLRAVIFVADFERALMVRSSNQNGRWHLAPEDGGELWRTV